MNFENKVCIVTGAASGIGKATAELLAKQGAKLSLMDINEEKINGFAEELRKNGTDVIEFCFDISDVAEIKNMINETLEHFGKIDVLINNAGIYKGEPDFENQDISDWKKLIDINIIGTMAMTQAVLPAMKKQHSGRIINLGSVAATYGISYMITYSTTKGAIHSFTKALSKQVAEYGINVNTVAPGNIREDLTVGADMSFMGRAGSYEECANVICFLASEEASYVTGQCYTVDGGRKLM